MSLDPPLHPHSEQSPLRLIEEVAGKEEPDQVVGCDHGVLLLHVLAKPLVGGGQDGLAENAHKLHVHSKRFSVRLKTEMLILESESILPKFLIM